MVGGAAGDGIVTVSTVVARHRDRRGLGVGGAVGWIGGSEAGGIGDGLVLALVKTEPRRARSSMALLLRLLDRAPCRTASSFPAAAMAASSGVTAGLEMYLCL